MPASTAANVGAGFETASPGTSEAIWLPWLDTLRDWLPDRAPLFVIAPHPDDETLGAGGLMSVCARRGDVVSVICVTDGEAARPEMSNLAAIRLAELNAAAGHILGNRAPVACLGLPDGDVTGHESELIRQLESRIPHHATLIAPFEHDGHPDHDTIGRVCIELATKHDLNLARYPIWAWHRLTPSSFHAEQPVKVFLDEHARAAKNAAIQCYRSQTEDRPGGAIVPEHVLSYFRRPHEVYFL